MAGLLGGSNELWHGKGLGQCLVQSQCLWSRQLSAFPFFRTNKSPNELTISGLHCSLKRPCDIALQRELSRCLKVGQTQLTHNPLPFPTSPDWISDVITWWQKLPRYQEGNKQTHTRKWRRTQLWLPRPTKPMPSAAQSCSSHPVKGTRAILNWLKDFSEVAVICSHMHPWYS